MKDKFLNILDESRVLDTAEALALYGRDWIKDFTPKPALILFPNSYQEVQEILKICSKNKIKLVPSGGRTGLSGGATATDNEVVLCFDKLNKILSFNELEHTITCQAGVLTQVLQESASAKGFYFPIDFSSKGTSQIGGNIATNAGGIRVVRYGNIRDWVLGLKVVTAGGELIDLNGSLYKNQTGYDLKNLIIGSEGTLAVIVEATLKVTRPPGSLKHIICGLKNLPDVMVLFNKVRKVFSSLSVFEYFSRKALEEVLTEHSLKEPLSQKCAEYVLIEIEENAGDFNEKLENFLEENIENDLISDAVISQNSSQSEQFIKYRELIPETLNSNYTLHKNDLSLPISNIPVFINELDTLTSKLYPQFKAIIFGHIGDGNLHLNVLNSSGMEEKKFYDLCKNADIEIFKLVQKNRGSISAEHGIGLLKKDFLHFSRTETEINFMRQIKKVFDPNGILNPGKIFN